MTVVAGVHGPGVRRVATYLAARVLPALASMGLTFLCIRSLSAEAYGRYSLTLLPASVTASLIGGLAGQAILRYGHELAPAALRRGLVVLPLAASALACPLVLAYLGWSVGWSVAVAVAVALIPLVALMDTRRNLFVAQARARAVLAMDALRAGLALALAAVLLHIGGGRVEAPLLAQVASVAACLTLVRHRASTPGRSTASPLGNVGNVGNVGRVGNVDRRYVGYGIWFAAWLGAVGVISIAERSIVERVSGIAASGRYAAQADVVNAVFAAIGGALASSMMPRYLALGRAGRAAAGPDIRRLLRFGLAGTAAAAALCLGLGALVVGFGAGKLAAALTADLPTALTLVAAGAVWTAAGFVQKPLELAGQTRLTFASVLLGLGCFAALAPALAPGLGPLGVALSKLIAGLACVAGAVLFTARHRAGIGRGSA